MSLKQNKPYVWVDQNGTYPVICFLVKLEEGMGINPDAVEEEIQDNTLYLKYTIDEYSGTFEETPVTLSMQPYNNIDRVVVQIHQGNTMLGFHVVQPNDGNFSQSGATPGAIPYVFLQSNAVDSLKLYIAVYLPEQARLVSTETPEDFNNFIQGVKLSYVRDGNGGPEWHYEEVDLNPGNGFDPVLEDILVEVIIADGDGGNEKKGHGTTHGSEGDASGEE